MGKKLNRMEMISQLYQLGTQAESLITELSELEDDARRCRLEGEVKTAQMKMTQYRMVSQQLEGIGKLQSALIAELEAAGEILYL